MPGITWQHSIKIALTHASDSTKPSEIILHFIDFSVCRSCAFNQPFRFISFAYLWIDEMRTPSDRKSSTKRQEKKKCEIFSVDFNRIKIDCRHLSFSIAISHMFFRAHFRSSCVCVHYALMAIYVSASSCRIAFVDSFRLDKIIAKWNKRKMFSCGLEPHVRYVVVIWNAHETRSHSLCFFFLLLRQNKTFILQWNFSQPTIMSIFSLRNSKRPDRNMCDAHWHIVRIAIR